MSAIREEINLPFPVRDSRPWTLEKLTFLSKYLTAYVKATQKIKNADVCFMDIFAGPGRDRIRETGNVVDGSPLIAMKLYPGFRRFIFGDIELPFLRQLEVEAKKLGIENITHTIPGDANVVVSEALKYAPKDGATFCFLDPPGIDVNWDTIRKIAHYKPPGRNKPELFILFAYDMDLVRFLVREGNPVDVWGEDAVKRIDRAMPDPYNWKAVYEARNLGQIYAREARRRFAYVYWMGLKNLGYKYVVNPKLLTRPSGQPLYFLFFASDHPVGGKIMSEILSKSSGPKQLGFDSLEETWILEDPWDFKQGESWYVFENS